MFFIKNTFFIGYILPEDNVHENRRDHDVKQKRVDHAVENEIPGGEHSQESLHQSIRVTWLTTQFAKSFNILKSHLTH